MIASVDDAGVTSTFVFAELAGYSALTEAYGDERAAGSPLRSAVSCARCWATTAPRR
jgi:hypothetical protein